MEIKKFVVGPFQTNCYLLKKGNTLLAIDPGSGFRKLAEYIDSCNEKLAGILLTHGHFDHIGAVDQLVKKYHCPVYVCQDDIKMLQHKEYNNLAGFTASVESDVCFLESEKLTVGDFVIEVLYTPGHSAGSVMYIIEECLFSGDTLFHMGVGRTDLYSGSESKLRQSLGLLNTLPDEMVVYPGHEQATTVGFELENNPYLG